MKKVLIIAMLLGCVLTSLAQKPSLELTFTAIDSATHIQLDSIKVMNRTQGGDTVLDYPDTILVLDYTVGIVEVNESVNGLRIDQNYPNPVLNNTTIPIYIPAKGLVKINVTDLLGRTVQQYEKILESGEHLFSYTPGGGEMSFFTAFYGNSRETIKIMHPNLHQSSSAQLSYLGRETNSEPLQKATEAMQGFSFSLGDALLYIGYIDEMESGISDAPTESDTLYFQFATNIPCPGTPTVTYEGQVYNTIQIFSQCWMKENLNVGVMIPGQQDQINDSVIEKYCYDNDTINCKQYGGLYQWEEMMQYHMQTGIQGICPQGWHLPTNEEWKILEGTTDSEYGVGNSEWDFYSVSRGSDVGDILKSTDGWLFGGNGTDKYSFTGLASGSRLISGNFVALGTSTAWWASTVEDFNVWARYLYFDNSGVFLADISYPLKYGESVRCIKD